MFYSKDSIKQRLYPIFLESLTSPSFEISPVRPFKKKSDGKFGLQVCLPGGRPLGFRV